MTHVSLPAYSEVLPPQAVSIVVPVSDVRFHSIAAPPQAPTCAYAGNGIPGWMGLEEMRWLYNRAKLMDSVVEIGSWQGHTTHALLSACPHGIVYAVEHFKGSPTERNGPHHDAEIRDIGRDFFRNVGHFDNLYLMEMSSVEAAEQFADLSVDMVFIDGGHDYDSVSKDILFWWPKCRRLMCGHDVAQDGVPRAIKEFEDRHQLTTKRGEGSLWYVERAAA